MRETCGMAEDVASRIRCLLDGVERIGEGSVPLKAKGKFSMKLVVASCTECWASNGRDESKLDVAVGT